MPTEKKTIDAYSAYAEKWATIMRSGKNIAHEYLEKPAMYSRLPDLSDKRVLCLGCGTGEECNHLNEVAQEIVGVDISEGLINYAKKSYPELEFHVMDMEKLDFEDNSFDYVYSSLVMHYVDSWTKTLSEVHRILRPGGTFLFSTHHPATWGAERLRENGKRTSLLGYIKDLETKEAQVLGDYLNTHKVDTVWFKEFPVSFFHRPLESMFDDILSSELTLKKLLEPKPVEKTKEVDLRFYKIREKIPIFIIFELQK
tara:strand:- start:3286 stop:4053 length:768 start_codon:yes stop_codon:yes gene_type:complete